MNAHQYKEPTTRKLEVKSESDNSGNNLAKEGVKLPTNDFKIKYHEKIDWSKHVKTREIKAYYGAELVNYRLYATQNSAEVYEKTYSIGNFGARTIATLGKAPMSLDKLNKKGLLGENSRSNYFKSVAANSTYYILWK